MYTISSTTGVLLKTFIFKGDRVMESLNFLLYQTSIITHLFILHSAGPIAADI